MQVLSMDEGEEEGKLKNLVKGVNQVTVRKQRKIEANKTGIELDIETICQ